MATAAVDIFNQLTDQYAGSITNIQTGSIALGSELFNNIALISIAVMGISHLLRKNVDLADANFELIRWLIYLNVFYLCIVHYADIYPVIMNFFDQIGNYLGAKAGGSSVDVKPGNIINIGFSISRQILFQNIKFNLFRNFLMILISVLAAAVVIYCFAIIAIDLILVQIGSHLILAGGIFLLAFSGLQWTKDYAERYVHTFFHIGIKMIFLYILVGLGVGLAQHWTQVLSQASMGQFIEYDIAVIMSTLVYYKLCQKIPDQAVSYLTGRLTMNFEAASTVNSAVKTIYKLPGAAVGGIAGIVGMSKAVSAASGVARTTLESQGKKENLINTGIETIKTLGEANKAVKQKAWDLKVNDTVGGKMAKNILSRIPKPKKETKKKSKDDADTGSSGDGGADLEEYSI